MIEAPAAITTEHYLDLVKEGKVTDEELADLDVGPFGHDAKKSIADAPRIASRPVSDRRGMLIP